MGVVKIRAVVIALLAGGAVVASCAKKQPVKPELTGMLFDCLEYDNRTTGSFDPGGQGRELLGFGLPAFALGSLRLIPVVRIEDFKLDSAKKNDKPIIDFKVIGTRLSGKDPATNQEMKPADWKGVTFDGTLRCVNKKAPRMTLNVTVKITADSTQAEQLAVWPDAGSGSAAGSASEWERVPLYALRVSAVEGFPVGHDTSLPHFGNALCKHGEGAFPIPGSWGATGKYDRGAGAFAFACYENDVAKCLRAGYALEPAAGAPDFLQMCGRMATADYCGDRNSYTVDGTDIRFYDTAGQQTPDTGFAGTFEAGWDGDGAVCVNHLRWPATFMTGIPKCDKVAVKCADSGAATSANPGKAMIFDDSCTPLPCMVHGVAFPFPTKR